MSCAAKAQLLQLRQIGWRYWDPIGLGYADGTWDDDCADEYDRYLLNASNMLCAGRSKEYAAAYLMQIEVQHMGLSKANERAAFETSVAIAEYLASLSGGLGNVS